VAIVTSPRTLPFNQVTRLQNSRQSNEQDNSNR
jgi:hypothetical protein